jgi:hypothetical protein
MKTKALFVMMFIARAGLQSWGGLRHHPFHLPDARERLKLKRGTVTTSAAILVGGLALTALAGCASRPVAINQPLTEVMRQSDFSLESKFSHDGTNYAVGKMYNSASKPNEFLIFIGGQLVGKAYPQIPGYDWKWVSQPDGLAYLASMLRRAGGSDSEMSPRELTSATVPIPIGKQPIPKATKAAADGVIGTAVEGAGQVAFMTVATLASFLLAPIAIPAVAVGATAGASTRAERSRIEPGMSRETVVEMLGSPSAVITLEGSDTDVLAYFPGDWSLNFAGHWYAGVREGQVIWTHTRQEWLYYLAKQAIENAKNNR